MPDGKIWAKDDNFHLDSFDLGNCTGEFIQVYFEPFAGAGECTFYVAQYNGDAAEEVGRERFEYYPGDTGTGDRSAVNKGGQLRHATDIVLYPNPARSSVSILLPGTMVSDGMVFQFYDARGAAIQQGFGGVLLNRQTEIPLTGLLPGAYWVRVSDKHGKPVEMLRFVKQ